jgi:hypothetical protein
LDRTTHLGTLGVSQKVEDLAGYWRKIRKWVSVLKSNPELEDLRDGLKINRSPALGTSICSDIVFWSGKKHV